MDNSNNYSKNMQNNFTLATDAAKSESSSEVSPEFSECSSDFETAILAAGFGKFNYMLYFISIFTGLSTVIEFRSMSYVFPAAQCDLDLGLKEKGMLNAVTISGMVCSGFLWGYVSDTIGRRTLIIFVCLLDALFCMVGALSQTFTLLMIAKFFGGMIISGAYASLASYLTELHCARHRAIVQLFVGSIYGIGDLLLPVLAITVLPSEIHWVVADFLVLHSWNVFLLICTLPPLISGIGFIFLPNSPKFLMSMGQNDKALEVFQLVYRINTNNPEESYPVKYLVYEGIELEGDLIETANKQLKISTQNIFSHCCSQIRPLFSKTHLKNIILVTCIQFIIILGIDSFGLWLPQIFQEIYENQQKNKSSSVCDALESLRTRNNSVKTTCMLDFDETKVYTNCIIVASTSILVFFLSGSVVNTIGKKGLLYILGMVSGLCTTALYFSKDITLTVTLSAISSAFGNISFNAMIAVVVDMFPTTIRAMSVSLIMTVGRLGGATGCFVLPIFLQLGCAPPIFFTGFLMIAWSQLIYFLPNTEMKALD